MQESTPQRKTDELERIKEDLAARWGLQFPETSWSPSKKDLESNGGKVSKQIQFLFWSKEPYLRDAIVEFEAQAPSIISEWQFKPNGDSDVLPSSQDGDSNLRKEFLHRQPYLHDKTRGELMNCLLYKLRPHVEHLKTEQSRLQSLVPIDSVEMQSLHASAVNDLPQSVNRSQSKLEHFFRNKSAPAPPPSSLDEYADDEIDGYMKNDIELHGCADKDENQAYLTAHSSDDSITNEDFHTPPEDLYPSIAEPLCEIFKKPAAPIVRKRPQVQAQTDVEPRKFSRSSSRRSSGGLRKASSSGSMRLGSPPSSFESNSTKTSFGTTTTRSSTTNTSLNTSFSSAYSADSRKTSFESWEESDDTIKPQPNHMPTISFDKSSLRSQSNDSLNTAGKAQLPSATGTDDLRSSVLSEIRSSSPFPHIIPSEFLDLPFRQIYETVRVCLSTQLPFHHFGRISRTAFTDYEAFWAATTGIVQGLGLVMPERSHPEAWNNATGKFKKINLGGTLSFTGLHDMKIKLKTLSREKDHRLGRKYGNHRFLVLDMSSPEHLKNKRDAEVSRQAFLDWLVGDQHEFLGRKWRPFYVKGGRSKRASASHRDASQEPFQVYMFAEESCGSPTTHIREGERDISRNDIEPTTLESMLQWFLPFERNLDQLALKLFARLGLAVSKNVKTAYFRPNQILRSDDAHAGDTDPRRINLQRSQAKKLGMATGPASTLAVMNDGCARISRVAARAVADHLNLDYVPSAFQGRIAGAKGIWMVDVSETGPIANVGDFWIEITDSQLKFESHAADMLFPDEDRTTFEVNDWVKKLQPASLNFQLIPILRHCGVPTEVFERILREDLTTKISELQACMTDPLDLRRWNQRNNSEQQTHAEDMQGGLPRSTQAKIARLIDQGFEPKDCQFLKELLRKAAHRYCDRLQEKLDVSIGQSAFPFMIADPTGTLEEGEVHLCFSDSFKDQKSGFDDTMLHDRDMLVARSPAHLPSHIQKVRAVFKPELRAYRDVIVFSSKGEQSLADQLSGGDYDGDRAWVCWHDDIVKYFSNCDPPPEPALDVFGITKDRTRTRDIFRHGQNAQDFVRLGFDFNVRSSKLGGCSNYFEQLCYTGRYPINSERVIELGFLLGFLVDSAKGGFTFDETAWQAYLERSGLPKPYLLRRPAYKERKDQKPSEHHIIDFLVFGVAKVIIQETLKSFSQQFPDVSSYDDDLVAICKAEEERAKSSAELRTVLDNLTNDMKHIIDFWSQHCRHRDGKAESFGPSKSTGLSFAEVVEHCRRKFIDLSPRAGPDIQSDRIREWQTQHAKKHKSHWDHVKASCAFKMKNRSVFVWYTAGVELGEIKALAEGSSEASTIKSRFYKALKPDSKYIDGIKRREEFEARIAAFADDSDDDDDEIDDFGSWSWANDTL